VFSKAFIIIAAFAIPIVTYAPKTCYKLIKYFSGLFAITQSLEGVYLFLNREITK
jgi:hypothetical protein